MKRLLSVFLLITVILSMLTTACKVQTKDEAALTINLKIGSDIMTVNGKEIYLDSVPIIQNNIILMPVGAVVEAMGGNVKWDEAAQKIILKCAKNKIQLTVGNTTAYLNGEPQTLDCAPTIIDDQVMSPIRFIAESFNFGANWKESEQTVTITNIDKASEEAAAAQNIGDKYKAIELWFKNGNSKIYGEVYLPGDGSETYPTVILSHGFGGNSSYDLQYAKMLAAKGIACCVFDFCGGGFESKSDGDMLSMSVITETGDLEAVIEQIQKQDFFDGQLFLMGESQGGCVSALTAAQTTADIKGLILFYPAFVIPDYVKELFDDESQVPETFTIFGMTVGKKYYEDALSLDIYGTIGAYTGDVLIVHGDSDTIVPISYSQRALETYASAELITIEGAGHGFSETNTFYAGEKTIEFIKNHAEFL